MASLGKRTSSRAVLLMTGYIRAIEFLLENNVKISNDILRLCYQFYKSAIKLGISYSQLGKLRVIDPFAQITRLTDSFAEMESQVIDSFAVMDADSKSMTHYGFVDKKQNVVKFYMDIGKSWIASGLSLLIDSAKFKMNIKNAQHSIFCMKVTKTSECRTKAYPCFLFLGGLKNENKILYQLASARKMKKFKTVSFARKRNTIYAAFRTRLYALQLTDVVNNDFMFEQLPAARSERFWKHHIGTRYLTLEYIENEDKLFAIQCQFDYPARLQNLATGYDDTYQREKRKAICGIYDFVSNEWKKVSSFKYKWYDNDFVCITTYDKLLDVIYIQSNIGYTISISLNVTHSMR